MQSQAGNWSHRLSPRHAELLLLLALNPDGLTAAELSTELFGSLDHAVAVRAEMSRLRKHLGGVLCPTAVPIRGLGAGPRHPPGPRRRSAAGIDGTHDPAVAGRVAGRLAAGPSGVTIPS